MGRFAIEGTAGVRMCTSRRRDRAKRSRCAAWRRRS